MPAMSIEVTRSGPAWIDYAKDGDTVAYIVPAGCALRRSADLQVWEAVVTPPPFVHTGAPAHYRIDCDTYGGTPFTATLTIESPQ